MLLIHKGTIVTSEKVQAGSILIDGERISNIVYDDDPQYAILETSLRQRHPDLEIRNIEGLYVIAGGIDPHVHFRDPGLTNKADMSTESRAAAAGGITTVIDMPNTRPATVDAGTLRQKKDIAKEKSLINILFHLGVTNTNVPEIKKLISQKDEETGVGPEDFAGLKVFMGSSTGNMLVDDADALDDVFSISGKNILVHCEDEQTIKDNLKKAVEQYGEDIPWEEHSRIRSRRACIKSSIAALEKAISHHTKLTLCHISTKEEVEMVRAAKLSNPEITAETSCNYLWFSDEDYERLGSRIKCNPSIKTAADRQALRDALANGVIDIIASDHAPHLLSEKKGNYRDVPSGIPSIQHSLQVLLSVAEQEDIPLERIASVWSEKAADIYALERGKIRRGWYADLVVFDPKAEHTVTEDELKYKCGWSPYVGEKLKGEIRTVYLAGKPIVDNVL